MWNLALPAHKMEGLNLELKEHKKRVALVIQQH
jgi:hypothetical protein